MKKTIITAALCLGMAAAHAATFTSSSLLTTESSGFPEAEVELFSKIAGKNNDNAVAAVGTFEKDGNTHNYLVEVGQGGYTTLNSKSITLNELYNATTLDTTVVLDSYSFITRLNTTVTNNLYVQVLKGTELLGTSNVVSYDTNATTNGVHGIGTFTFNTDIILNSAEAYTFQLVTKSGDSYTANTTNVAMGVANPYYYANQGGGYTIDGNAGWQPIISIATHSVPAATPAIPEPTTATLSLLALAGLAARRRRK